MADEERPRRIGRYRILEEIASGGMATVRVGVLDAGLGFSRLVAIKSLHENLARVPGFVAMLIDEARLTTRVSHANVVSVLDVVEEGDRLHLVMAYVSGASLATLFARAVETKAPIPLPVVSAVIRDALQGLHAAHTATDESRQPLDLVHRDVSPQNVLVGLDGVARVIDFGIAKATKRLQETSTGVLKGKIAYMAPELFDGDPATAQSDVYGVAVALWELLTLRRLYAGEDETAVVAQVRLGMVEPPSFHVPGVPRVLDDVVMRGLALAPGDRFLRARDMLEALERAAPAGTATEVSEWVRALAGEAIEERALRLAKLEADAREPESSPFAIPDTPEGTSARPAPASPVAAAKAGAWRPAAIAGAALTLAGLAVALGGRASREPHETPALPASVSNTAAVPLPEPTAPEPTAHEPSTPPPERARHATPVPTATSRSPARRATPASSDPRPPKDDCEIPYRIGPDRHRTYKPECLVQAP